jgi:hypothetical protein
MRDRWGDVVINAGAVTTFNECAVGSENRCVALPQGVPMDVGVLFGCALLTGASMAVNKVGSATGRSIAVFGLDGVGMSALLACGLDDPAQIIAVNPSRETPGPWPAELGATATLDPPTCDVVAEIRRLTDGRGVYVSIEAAGLARTIRDRLRGGASRWRALRLRLAPGKRRTHLPGASTPDDSRLSTREATPPSIPNNLAAGSGVTLDFFQAEEADNAFIVALKGRFRAECLNAYWFLSLADAQKKLEDWRGYYNEERA